MLDPRFTVALAIVSASCGGTTTPTTKETCGDARVSGAGDLEAFSGCPRLRSLTVVGGAPLDLTSLGRLREISGDLIVGPTSRLSSLAGLGGLARVGGAVRIGHNFELGGVYLNGLATVGGDLSIVGNPSLLSIATPSLSEVGGSFVLSGNRSLESILAPSLRAVAGALDVEPSPRLTVVIVSSEIEARGFGHKVEPKGGDPLAKPAP